MHLFTPRMTALRRVESNVFFWVTFVYVVLFDMGHVVSDSAVGLDCIYFKQIRSKKYKGNKRSRRGGKIICGERGRRVFLFKSLKVSNPGFICNFS